jgi:hypothetical protein
MSTGVMGETERGGRPWNGLGGGSWAITTVGGRTVGGYLPAWAAEDPSEQGVLEGELAGRLADVNHYAVFEGQRVEVYTPANRGGRAVEEEILHGSIDCNPYAEEGEPRVPVVNLHLAGECWAGGFGPEELGRFAGQLRAQAELLENEVRPALVAARADWAEHGIKGAAG